MAPIRAHNKTRTGLRSERSSAMKHPPASKSTISPSPPPAPKVSLPDLAITLLDMEIIHHYSTITCATLCEDSEAVNVWRVVVPHIAFQPDNRYLLHAILAVAATHRHTLNPTYPLPTHTPQSRYLITNYAWNPTRVYGFASSSTSVYAPTKWLTKIRSMSPDLLAQWPQFQDGPTAPLARIMTPQVIDPPVTNFPASVSTIHLAGPDIEEVQDIVVSAAYENAVILLKRSWDASFHADYHLLAASTLLTIASDRFMLLLREGRPRALIVFAYYCMMMRRMEKTWWTRKKWSEEVEKIETMLDARWMGWIEKPPSPPEWESDPNLMWMFRQPLT
ncbi:hypothetical protein CPB85DRAFT_1433688 [Mucidula mucida]|nr:hypothetical protein CPB85DRAFT_1433688 [Mucidula mucida]